MQHSCKGQQSRKKVYEVDLNIRCTLLQKVWRIAGFIVACSPRPEFVAIPIMGPRGCVGTLSSYSTVLSGLEGCSYTGSVCGGLEECCVDSPGSGCVASSSRYRLDFTRGRLGGCIPMPSRRLCWLVGESDVGLCDAVVVDDLKLSARNSCAMKVACS